MTTILYFSWVREAMGCGAEDVDLPESLQTVDDLANWLADRNPAFADLMRDRGMLRFAVDQHYADENASVTGAREIAIFPPVTGG